MKLNKYCTYDPTTKVWSGSKYTPIYNTEANLGYLILQKLIRSPRNVLQISDDTGNEFTNLEICRRSLKFANFFSKSEKLHQNHVVGLIASNCENLSSIIFACFTLGIAVNPLAIVMNEVDICYMWSKTKPKVIFCDAKIVETVRRAADQMELDTKIVTLMEKVDGYLNDSDILEAEEEFCFEDFEFPDLPDISSTTALIACSFGTTNAPKGICKSHKQIITQVIPMVEPNLESQEVYFINMWSYSISFIWFIVTCALYDMKFVITTKPTVPDLWMDIVDKHKVTFTVCPPRFGSVFLKSKSVRPLPSLKHVIVAGSSFNEKLIDSLIPLFPNGIVRCGYGCTESDSISSTTRDGPKGSSSGYPFKNVQIKICDDSGKSLGPNEIGEMYYKTSVPFSAYFGDPENYANSFDANGFVKSGDVGYVDDEGRLYILDRIKHMIKSQSGIKVTPVEIEEVINEIDGVMFSCVVGVFDDNLFYDKIYAFVIKDKMYEEVTEEFVKNYVNEKVSITKRIDGGVIFVDKFPQTPFGKVLNRELKKIAEKIHCRKIQIV